MTELTGAASRDQVAVIILNWNGRKDTLECIESVLKSEHRSVELIVIDNGSTDGSQLAIKAAYPDITLLDTGQNLGYAEGNNVGMRWALAQNPDFLLILNNDTIVAPNMLGRLLETSRQLPRSILGPLTFYHQPADEVWWAGTAWRSDKGTFIHMGAGERGLLSCGSEPTQCDYVVGSAMFAPVQVFREIGLFDPLFFLTYEETDWCYRARKGGWKCYCEPRAVMWHKVAAAMGGTGSPLQTYFYTRNALLWGERYLSRSEYWRLLGRTLAGALRPSVGKDASQNVLKRAFWAVSGVARRISGRGAHPISRAIFLGLRDYLCRRFGDCPDEVRGLNSAKKNNDATTHADSDLPQRPHKINVPEESTAQALVAQGGVARELVSHDNTSAT